MTNCKVSGALAVIAFGFMNGSAIANATSYTITVDASQQTAGNPRFWAASVGTGTASLTLRADLQTHYKLANRELGMQRVRGHGVLSDDMGIYKGPGSYDWTNLDTYLNAIVSAGMRPFMELDYMPTALALTGSKIDFPKDINTYKQFIQAVVQHCVTGTAPTTWGNGTGRCGTSRTIPGSGTGRTPARPPARR